MSDEQGISVGAFAQQLKTMIERFENHWRRKNASDPFNHPDYLTEGEWWEHFEVWIELGEPI